MASIELGVPIGPQTTFRIASVSKQFTCAAILLLAAEGRLSIDDDVRRYLPALPDLGHRITLAHLMHNTSGIRDMLEIMRLGGVDLGQPCAAGGPAGWRLPATRAEFRAWLALSLQQLQLHAARPYRRAGQRLTVRAISSTAASSLPLGMNATRHVERTTEVVANLATGYFPARRWWLDAGAARFPAARRGRPGFVRCRPGAMARALCLAAFRRIRAGKRA